MIKPESQLTQVDALWCSPGSPYLSLDGALNGIRFARERGWPIIGTCAGFQHIVLEYARNVIGIKDAAHQCARVGGSFFSQREGFEAERKIRCLSFINLRHQFDAP